MIDFLTMAGPLIWPVILLGLVGLYGAVRYVLEESRPRFSLAVGATVTSMITALLATVAGFQKSVGGLKQVAADDRWIYLWGLKESLNNVVVALTFAALVSLLLMISNSRRQGLREAH